MFQTECDLKEKLSQDREIAGLGLVILLICFFTYVLLGVQSWFLMGVSLLGAIVLIDGVRRYVKTKRGLNK